LVFGQRSFDYNISDFLVASFYESSSRHCQAIMASNTAALFTIYLLVVFYALCYQLQAPIEPFLVDKLIGKDEDSAATYGRLGSFFSIVQTVGSLSFGYLLDRAGVRIGFGVNFLCCALTYYILANCTSIEMLYISKLPGIGMAGFLCAQTAVSRITEGEDRIVALGRLTTSYTIGGSLGPYLGGILGSTGDYYVGAKAATVGSLIACVVAFLLPAAVDECKDLTPAKDKKGKKGDSDVPWVGRVKIVLTSVGLLLFIKVATSVANSMAASAQPLILKNR
jgi:OCT family organic cation transporter-like MFS transporter 18